MSTERPRVAVIRFPGMNCEEETRRAVAAHGMSCDVFMWNGPTAGLASYDGYVLPGGFSYQDRVRAGAIAAKDRVLDCLSEQARAGKPVIGICNGAQILLEAGLVPGTEDGRVQMGLARNVMPDRDGYYTRWTHVRLTSTRSAATCSFTEGDVAAIPIAHAEGRFVTTEKGLLPRLLENGQVVMRYVSHDGQEDDTFPTNPNGSVMAIAGLSNPRGNVVAMMPHPERASWLFQVPRSLPGGWGARRRAATRHPELLEAAGPAGRVFESLRTFIEGV
jgi:phosphoribosylformylglycinamidine synthase I